MSIIRYIPSSLANQLAGFRIANIYACAYQASGVSAPATGGNPKTNHWVLYCASSSGKSIRIDPTPAGPNLSIVPIVTEKEYQYTHNAVKITQLRVHDLTVKQFIDLIEINKYDKYQFSPSGQGCRYWIYNIFQLLASCNLVSAQSEIEAAVDALGKVWAEGGALAPAAEQTPITKGKFYALEQ